MKSSDDYQIAKGLSIMLLGEPKTGKTNVAAAFPNPYFLDVDGNLASAARVLAGKKFWFDTPAREVKEIHEVWKHSLQCLIVAKKDPAIETYVIDSISLLSEFMCAWCIQEHVRMGDVDKSGKKIEAMTIPDYGKLLSMLRNLVFDLRSTGKYVVFTSHITANQDELTKVMRYSAAIPGQAKDTLSGAFSDAWACAATPGALGKVKYEICTAPTGFHPALGTSIRTIPHRIDITGDNPTQVWAKLSKLIGHLPPVATSVAA